MFFVALSGIFGFLIFDGYRLNFVRQKKGVVEFFSDGLFGILVKVFVYFCAGALAIFASLDVLIGQPFWCSPSQEFVGSYLRGFAIGLAGPAGISKYDPNAGISISEKPPNHAGSLDSLDYKRMNLTSRLIFALRRQFLW